MQNKKIKVYTVLSCVCGGIYLIAVVWWLVLLGVAGWHLLAIRPLWLGFLLMMVAGLSMALACVFLYLLLSEKQQRENTVFCPACGGVCSIDHRFCPECGECLDNVE